MLDDRHADLSREREHVSIEVGSQSEGQQLILGAEISSLKAFNVLRILRGGAGAPVIGKDRSDAGFLQRANASVAVLRCVRNLRDVDDRGRAHVDEAERRHQHPGISIRRLIGRRQDVLNVAVIVGIEQAVHQDVAQEPLIGMAVGVDETGNDDPVRGIDDRGHIARHLDIRPNLADLAALDQHVRLREVADLPVEGEHDAALEQNAAFTLYAGKLGVCGSLCPWDGSAPPKEPPLLAPARDCHPAPDDYRPRTLCPLLEVPAQTLVWLPSPSPTQAACWYSGPRTAAAGTRDQFQSLPTLLTRADEVIE